MTTQQKNANPNPFGAPEAGDLPVDRKYYPVVEYGTMKTPQLSAKHITKEMINEALATCKLGFSFWDKDAGQRIHVGDGFTFVVLDVFSQISGQKEIGPKTYERYYSNKVKDSRSEPFAIFRQGEKKPIEKGLYQELKGDEKKGIASRIPKGCSFHLVFVVYWIEQNRVLNLKGSVMVSQQMKRAIAQAEASVGRTKKESEVSLFALADSPTAFWGFKFQTYIRVNKEGQEYKDSGDVYFVPVFYTGTIKADGPNGNPDLFAICKGYQDEIKSEYQAMKERRKQYGEEVDADDDHSSAPPVEDERFPAEEQAPPPPSNTDDLPF
jgi:hypothetical protein